MLLSNRIIKLPSSLLHLSNGIIELPNGLLLSSNRNIELPNALTLSSNRIIDPPSGLKHSPTVLKPTLISTFIVMLIYLPKVGVLEAQNHFQASSLNDLF